MFDRAFPLADGARDGIAGGGEGLHLIGIDRSLGPRGESGLTPAEKGVAEVVEGDPLVAGRTLSGGSAEGLGGFFEIATLVGLGSEAQLEKGALLGRGLFGEGEFEQGNGIGIGRDGARLGAEV